MVIGCVWLCHVCLGSVLLLCLLPHLFWPRGVAQSPLGVPLCSKTASCCFVSELGRGTIRWLPRGGAGACPVPRNTGGMWERVGDGVNGPGFEASLPEAWERCFGKCPLPQLPCWELTSKPQGARGALGSSSSYWRGKLDVGGEGGAPRIQCVC